MQYPIAFEDNDTMHSIIFLNIPTATPVSAQTREEALCKAQNELIRIFDMYFKKKIIIPETSSVGESFISIPASMTAKIILLNALIRTNTTNTRLAKMMNIRPQEVQRLVSLKHPTKIDTIEKALKALGYNLSLSANI
ncbi:hypothetical protein [Buttiauxella noackiae]|uniref:hypothetical protein n=1 Tax=Buttiauxella noackiae TaxID=82992 RepID=UPI0005538C75|nr:hypothetical protein [Buttiauxella noackiae]